MAFEDMEKISVNMMKSGLGARRADMDSQAAILRIERELESARRKLGNIRSDKYKSGGSTSAPTSISPPTPAQLSRECMKQLLALQNTQGAFIFSVQLSEIVGVALSSLQDILDSRSAVLQIDDDAHRAHVWATILALAYLKKKLPDLADEWELVDKKARKWLASQKILQQGAIFEAAEGLL